MEEEVYYGDCDYKLPVLIKLTEMQEAFIKKVIKLIDTDEDFKLLNSHVRSGKTFALHVLDKIVDERRRNIEALEKCEEGDVCPEFIERLNNLPEEQKQRFKICSI